MLHRKYRQWRSGARSCFYILFVVSLGWLATPAQAGLSSVTFEVNAQSSLGSGSFQVTLGLTSYDVASNTWSWILLSPITILDGSTTIATLDEASFTYISDPQVNFGFTVTAGAADTEFTITSGLLSFATIDPASGFASAGLLLTDDGSGAATLSGLGPTDGAYLSQYNGLVPGGTTFAELMTSPLSVIIANGTSAATGEFPLGGGFAAIGVPVFDMSAHFHFLLTADDIASGSSSFVIIPAPGALGLLAIGLIGRRRRRRPLRRTAM